MVAQVLMSLELLIVCLDQPIRIQEAVSVKGHLLKRQWVSYQQDRGPVEVHGPQCMLVLIFVDVLYLGMKFVRMGRSEVTAVATKAIYVSTDVECQQPLCMRSLICRHDMS